MSVFSQIGKGVSVMSDEFFKQFGGRPIIQGPGEEPAYNFGLMAPNDEVMKDIGAQGSLWDKYPALKGKWDKRTTINHLDAARSVLGSAVETLIQNQPRGTCGGRAGSFTGDLVQLIMIAAGKRAEFKRVSHAAVYYAARKLYNMLGGRVDDERNDGVASGSVPKALESVAGFVHREEGNDPNYYGPGSDDLAVRLGCGLDKELAAKIIELGKDNFITDWAPVYSADELADGIAAGGVGLGSDAQGFSLSRDSDGFCAPRGTWYHYHTRVSVIGGDRPGFGYFQSWGKGNPSGPMLPGHFGNCFGVDFAVQDRVIRSGQWCVVFGFPLWELKQDLVHLDWAK